MIYYHSSGKKQLVAPRTDGSIAQLVRALALQARGHRFESYCSHQHHYGPVVQLVRTLACHARGQGFESPSGRHNTRRFLSTSIASKSLRDTQIRHASVAQLVEQGTENPRVVGSIPIGGTTFGAFRRTPADLAHLVERDLAKVEVAGSSPVIRSIRSAKSRTTVRDFVISTIE